MAEPLVVVRKGNPDAVEVAALVAVLTAARPPAVAARQAADRRPGWLAQRRGYRAPGWWAGPEMLIER